MLLYTVVPIKISTQTVVLFIKKGYAIDWNVG